GGAAGAVRRGDGGIGGGARPGTIVAVHSPLHPDTAPDLVREAAPYGVAVVDAPVSGGVLGAHDGTLAVMAGGSPEAVRRLRPALQPWAALVVPVGPPRPRAPAPPAPAPLPYAPHPAARQAQRPAHAARPRPA